MMFIFLHLQIVLGSLFGGSTELLKTKDEAVGGGGGGGGLQSVGSVSLAGLTPLLFVALSFRVGRSI